MSVPWGGGEVGVPGGWVSRGMGVPVTCPAASPQRAVGLASVSLLSLKLKRHCLTSRCQYCRGANHYEKIVISSILTSKVRHYDVMPVYYDFWK